MPSHHAFIFNAFIYRLNHSNQILVLTPLYSPSPVHCDSGLGHMTCFGQRDISRWDISRGLMSTCTLGLAFSGPRCHARKIRSRLCSWRQILRLHRERPFHPRVPVEPNPEPIFQPKATTRGILVINRRNKQPI